MSLEASADVAVVEDLSSNEVAAAEENVGKVEDEANRDEGSDPGLYAYLNRQDFTSEIYKIEVGNLPLKFGYGQLRKLLNNKLKLNSHKIKGVGQNATWAFVTFRCADDRERALSILQGYKWKGKLLKVKLASPVADPIAKKRCNEEEDEPAAKKIKQIESTDDHLPVAERLKKVVSPLSDVPYAKQLEMKEADVRHFLVLLGRAIKKAVKHCPRWLLKQSEKYGSGSLLRPIQASPVVDGYRNKCEFTIGLGAEKERTVGFRLNRYTAGCMAVAEITDCPIVPDIMKHAVQAFQEYVRDSDKEPFNPETYVGYWRQLTLRTNSKGQLMAIVVMHPQKLTQDELKVVKDNLSSFFAKKSCGDLISAYFQAFAHRTAGEDAPLEHIYGDEYIYEHLLGMTFRISPDAFFQINSAGAEVLYSAIARHLQDGGTPVSVIDVCCGTGTIGMTLAKSVSKVVGIEMIQHAVEDAQHNAKMNAIDNIKFVCGKAEEVLYPSLASLADEKLIAVVDPPRAGLHNRVIRMLRSCQAIQQLIYISCDPKAAIINFVDLVRPVSNQYRGDPFVLSSATPVDLFPHTSHCELILVFDRLPEEPKPSNGTAQIAAVTVTAEVKPEESTEEIIDHQVENAEQSSI